MQRFQPQRREQEQPLDIEHLLKTRYSQLLVWGQSLTRGDVGKAQDIVQELCLYFTLKQPDLSNVENVEGYLYTSLRHIFVSSLARASREASQVTSLADFDSFDFAMASRHRGDPLERQNHLRRICNFTIWRKETSKTASYFILHFFHGYSRHETAQLACLPISAIYNKIRIARAEIKSHLEDAGKLRIASRDLPPPAPRSWTVVSAPDLFQELRNAILSARQRGCIPEQQLLAFYNGGKSEPIPCALLSHIVSCERCLALIDQHFQRPGLDDREPLDSTGSSGNTAAESVGKLGSPEHAFEVIQRRRKQVFEHRPNTLSIAHNGKIVASHDVVSSRSTLSARIAHPERDHFIEVFSEQDVRLALLSIDDMPPSGPGSLKQRIHLSDSRWLELLVTFDGLGLDSQVTYYDEALAGKSALASVDEADAEFVGPIAIPHGGTEAAAQKDGLTPGRRIGRLLQALTPSPAFAWALLLLLSFGAAGYLLLRNQSLPLDAAAVLDRSIEVETAASQGTTEHQLLRIEEMTADGLIKQRGTVELWKDGDGSRSIHRLYDMQHRLVAAKWHNKRGTHSHVEESLNRSSDQKELLNSDIWQQELSAVEFRRLGGQETFAATANGYELKSVLPAHGRSHLTSATLVLDRNFRPLQQILEVHSNKRNLRLRFTQISLVRSASTSVPDSEFDPADFGSGSPAELHPSRSSVSGRDGGSARQLTELHIATLYQLYALGADVGQPIEVAKTSDGHLRISGSVSNPALRKQIVKSLKGLENSDLLDLQLSDSTNAAGHKANQLRSSNTVIYEVGAARPPIDPSLRAYLSSKNIPEEKLVSSVEQYSGHVLLLSQHALQDAYALHRLGSVFSASDMGSFNPASQRRWTEMVVRHSADLNSELDNLSQQVLPLDSEFHNPSSPQEESIENAEQFFHATDEILARMQEVNRTLGILFTANAAPALQATPHSLLDKALSAMPLRQASEIRRFASKLNASLKAQSGSSASGENIGVAP